MKGDSKNHFEGPMIPFGAMVEYHPISSKDQSFVWIWLAVTFLSIS